MIKIEKLSKSYGKKQVLNNFNYTINKGTITAITGKSGCGKSTLLNIIGLLDMEYEGEILYDDKSLKKLNDKKRSEYIRNNINYLFQNYALIDNESVKYNLMLALEYDKCSKTEKIDKIKEALKLVDLDNYIDKKIYTLSGGEQQRVAMARIILKKGNLVLADEPTGNLDEINSTIVINNLKKMKSEGKTIIVVTHNEEVAKQCDVIIRL